MMDMHCHLDLYKQPEEIIKKCALLKMYVLSVTTTPKAWHQTNELIKGLPRFKTALGLHPQLAHLREHELPLFDSLINETNYIGEIGLDGSKEYLPHIKAQLRVFRHILERCELVEHKILTLHSRGAVRMLLDELELYPKAGTPILHWFLGTKGDVIRGLEMNCYFSIGPAMTESKRGRSVIKWLPKERVLLETDGPFAKFKQKQIEPPDTFNMINYLSKEWNLSEEDVSHTLKENLNNLVSIN